MSLEISLVTGQPNRVGTAKVYVMDGDLVNLDVAIADSDGAQSCLTIPFATEVAIGGKRWMILSVAVPSAEAGKMPPGRPVPVAVLKQIETTPDA